MTCLICKDGQTAPGLTTVTLERASTIVVLKAVPADVCGTCGEYYLSEEISTRVMALANDAANKGAELEILRFAA